MTEGMKSSQSSSENEKAEEDADEENEKAVKDFDAENEKTEEDADEENDKADEDIEESDVGSAKKPKSKEKILFAVKKSYNLEMGETFIDSYLSMLYMLSNVAQI